jgi:hypothetical protein
MIAAGALGKIAERHPSAKDRVIALLTEYLDNPDPSATGLNGSAVHALIDLEARSSIETLRRLYRSGNVDLFACGDIEDVDVWSRMIISRGGVILCSSLEGRSSCSPQGPAERARV